MRNILLLPLSQSAIFSLYWIEMDRKTKTTTDKWEKNRHNKPAI